MSAMDRAAKAEGTKMSVQDGATGTLHWPEYCHDGPAHRIDRVMYGEWVWMDMGADCRQCCLKVKRVKHK